MILAMKIVIKGFPGKLYRLNMNRKSLTIFEISTQNVSSLKVLGKKKCEFIYNKTQVKEKFSAEVKP